MEKEQITVTEASKIVCVTPMAIRNYINLGVKEKGETFKLKATKGKKGRKDIWLILKSDLIEYKDRFLT